MPDLITAAALAYVSKDFLAKLLGPTAEYLGDGLKDFTQKRVGNVARIFKKAEAILGEKINENGEISPRILRKVIDEGSFMDDELSAEYFGGILASSRSNNTRDDRGISFLNLVESLSVYQIRTHYILYTVIKSIYHDSGYKINVHDRPKMETFIPMTEYINAMAFSEEELDKLQVFLSHSLFGLHKEGLIENFNFGNQEDLQKKYKKIVSHGICFIPSALGVELFLWVHGHGNCRGDELFAQDIDLKIQEELNISNDLILPTSQLR